jgi:uncharacterized protein YndB with AHSA1/START domain
MTTTTENPVVRLTRTIPAPPELVYRAWLEPDLIDLWMAPGEMSVTRSEVDERVGGMLQVWQSREGSEVGGFESEILELDPGRRIVFRWGFVGPERGADPAQASLLTLTFGDAPDGATELTLVHERLDALETGMPGMADKVNMGWGLALDKLAATAWELPR